jgi:outer membrane protein, heavy metal efflux system
MRNPITTILLASVMCAAAQEAANPIARQGPEADLLQGAAERPAMKLEEFRQLALASNPTLRQVEAQVDAAGSLARQAGLYPNPSVGYQGEQIRGGFYGGGEQGAYVQQAIVLGGKLGLRRNVYEQQRRAEEIGMSEQRYRVLSDISQGFYAALAAQELVTLRGKLLGVANDAVATAHQLSNVGQADAPDVLQAEVESEQAKIDLVTAQRSYIQTFQTLAARAGKPELELSRVAGELEQMPQVDAEQVVSKLIRESPAARRAQQEVVRAQAAVKSAKRESVPDVLLRGGVQQNFEPIGERATLRTGLQGFASAGVSLPIFNRNQGNVAAALAELRRAEAEAGRVALSLRENAQPLVQMYLTDRMQAARYKDNMIPRALLAYKLYLTKYQEMGAAYPQVLVSQRTLFRLQVEYIRTLEDLWMNSIALENYTLAGGLSAPMRRENNSSTVNLPNSGGGQ